MQSDKEQAGFKTEYIILKNVIIPDVWAYFDIIYCVCVKLLSNAIDTHVN
jgi:hypothetical protein